MSSLVYLSCVEDEANGQIDFGADTFGVMLVDDTYIADAVAHRRRSDITGEVVGVGYDAGGVFVDVEVVRNNTGERIDVRLGDAAWQSSQITARGAVYFKSRGGSAADDELIAYNDFLRNRTSNGGLFTLAESWLRITV